MRNIWGGGAPGRFWEIHNFLVTAKKINVTLLATPDSSTYQKFDVKKFQHVKVIPIRIQNFFPDYLFYIKAAKIVRKIARNFDIVHDDFSPIAPYSFLWHPNTMATIHEVFRKNALSRYGAAGLAPVVNEAFYRKMKYRTIISCSPSTEKELKKLGVNSMMIPPGVNPKVYVPSQKNSEGKKIVITMIARFTPIKGHIYFVQIAKKLLKEYENLKFILPSTGPILPKIKELSQKIKIEN